MSIRLFTLAVVTALAVMATFLLGGVGQPNEDAPPSGGAQDLCQKSERAVGWVARLPQAAEVVIVIDGAAEMRGTQVWRAVEGVLGRSGVLKQATEPWSELSEQLGYTADEAFDRVCGKRLAIIMQNVGSDELFRSAIVAEISDETDRRMRERLAAAPKTARKDVQVLSVEIGRYQLATAESVSGSRLVVVGPTASPELFERCVDTLFNIVEPRKGGSGVLVLGETPMAVELGERMPEARPRLAAMTRIDPESGNEKAAEPREALQPWRNFIVVTGSTTARGISAKLVIRDDDLRAGLADVDVTSKATFERLSEGSPAAMLEWRSEVVGALSEPLSVIGLPDGIRRRLGRRQAVVLLPAEAPPRVSVSLAVELTDTSGAAPFCDGFVCEVLKQVRPVAGNGHSDPCPDFAGFAPSAVRNVPLEVPWFAPLFGDRISPHLAVGWSCTARSQQEPCGPGWWVLHVSPTGCEKFESVGPAVRRLADALTASEGPMAKEDDRRRWIMQGILRPNNLAEVLDWAPDLIGLRPVFAGIRVISWEAAVVDDEGLVEGAVDIEMAD